MADLDESRERFAAAWSELGDAVEQGTGLRPRPKGLGLLVIGAAVGLALAWSGRLFWTELKRQGADRAQRLE